MVSGPSGLPLEGHKFSDVPVHSIDENRSDMIGER